VYKTPTRQSSFIASRPLQVLYRLTKISTLKSRFKILSSASRSCCLGGGGSWR
jgi:hypothetical protein